MWCGAVLLTLMAASAGAAPRPPQEDGAYPEELAIYPADTPMASAPALVVREGADISLPCQMDGEHVDIVLWKKRPSMILYTGKLPITSDSRIKLGPDNELRISNITADDDGTYVCSAGVDQDPALELRHVVSVQYPVKLHPLDSDYFRIRENEVFQLNCAADGNPEPTITWSKLPSDDAEGLYGDDGEGVATTSVPEGDDMSFLPESPSKTVALKLDPVKPRHTGTYTCTAENGIGEPASLTAELEVIHPPHIALESDVVRTAHGRQAELGCTVFANPKAQVVWQRNGADLPGNSRYETAVSGRYFSLRIRDVKDEDLGNYTCLAKNDLGKSVNQITLTGLPGPVELHLSRPKMLEGGQQSTTVTWQFTSFSTIERTSVTLQPLDPAGPPEESLVPVVTSLSETKRGHQRLSPLDDNTTYLVRVRAENQYGWTPPADAYFSITNGSLIVTQEPPQLAESKSGAEDLARLKLTAILLVAILSSFF